MDPQVLLLLAVFLYLAGAIAALALNKAGRAANYASGLAALAAAIVGLAAAAPVLAGGASSTLNVAGFIPFARFVIEIDSLSAFMVAVISLLSAATSLYSLAYMDEYIGRGAGVMGFFNNLFIAAMLLVVTVGNAFYFLIFWELMTLASYFLVIFDQDEAATQAGFIYLLMAHAGTALIMVSFFIFFVQTGSFDFSSFRAAGLTPAMQSLAFLLAFFGFGCKAGIIPLHIWLPRAHPAAPSHASALMSGVMIKTAIYGMMRIGVDFLGGSIWWWGLIVLIFGTVSAVLGVLYALAEHDLKKLLAYHSVENIGIILMGVGAGMIGLAVGQPVLAVLGLMAGLYHLVNHAVFKGLLFLGAGSVVYRTHTKNMEEMGGLARQMPWTGLAFLIGAIAISAIPPLNGFVSEWFTYHSLFIASTTGGIWLVKVFAPLSVVMLALTGALAAMCFVKAYGVTFTGPYRSDHARQAKEVPASMIGGMVILAVGCIALGLGAPVVAPILGNVAAQLVNTSPVPVAGGISVFPADMAQATLSTPLLTVLLIGLLSLPWLVIVFYGGHKAGQRTDYEAWSCGYGYSSKMAITAGGFAQPLRVIFRPFYSLRTSLTGPGYTLASYFKGAVVYTTSVESMWENLIYQPIAQGVQYMGKRVQVLQMGDIRLYCLYIVLTLAVLLFVAMR